MPDIFDKLQPDKRDVFDDLAPDKPDIFDQVAPSQSVMPPAPAAPAQPLDPTGTSQRISTFDPALPTDTREVAPGITTSGSVVNMPGAQPSQQLKGSLDPYEGSLIGPEPLQQFKPQMEDPKGRADTITPGVEKLGEGSTRNRVAYDFMRTISAVPGTGIAYNLGKKVKAFIEDKPYEPSAMRDDLNKSYARTLDNYLPVLEQQGAQGAAQQVEDSISGEEKIGTEVAAMFLSLPIFKGLSSVAGKSLAREVGLWAVADYASKRAEGADPQQAATDALESGAGFLVLGLGVKGFARAAKGIRGKNAEALAAQARAKLGIPENATEEQARQAVIAKVRKSNPKMANAIEAQAEAPQKPKTGPGSTIAPEAAQPVKESLATEVKPTVKESLTVPVVAENATVVPQPPGSTIAPKAPAGQPAADALPAAKQAGQKQPWEMTPDEYVSYKERSAVAGGADKSEIDDMQRKAWRRDWEREIFAAPRDATIPPPVLAWLHPDGRESILHSNANTAAAWIAKHHSLPPGPIERGYDFSTTLAEYRQGENAMMTRRTTPQENIKTKKAYEDKVIAAVRNGQSVDPEILKSFKGQQWADDALAKMGKPASQTPAGDALLTASGREPTKVAPQNPPGESAVSAQAPGTIDTGRKGDFVSDPVEPTAFQQKRGGFVSIGGQKPQGVDKPWLDLDKTKSPDNAVEDFFGRTERITSVKARFQAAKDAVTKGLRERFVFAPKLPDTTEAAYARSSILVMKDQVRNAKTKAIEDVQAILDGDGTRKALDVAGLDLLRRKVFVEDLVSEAARAADEAGAAVKSGISPEAAESIKLRRTPRGLTPDQLAAEKSRIDSLLGQVPSVKDAYEKRQKLWSEVSRDLAERGVISEEAAKNPAYVRHIVLDYADDIRSASVPKKLKDPYRPYAKGRQGTRKDISTDYLEVELKALGDIYRDNAIQDLAEKLAERYQLSAAKGMAKSMPPVPAEAGQRVIATDRNNFGTIKSVSGDTALVDFTNKSLGIQADVRLQLSQLRSERGNPLADASTLTPEQIAAAKSEVGKLTPGYVEWQFKRGNVFYNAKTAPEAEIAKAIEAVATDPRTAKAAAIPVSALRDAMVVGGKRKGYIIPEWLAAQLDDLPVSSQKGKIASVVTPLVQWQKQWLLRTNPIRYNKRNLIGDSERVNAAGRSGAFARIPEAVRFLKDKTGEAYEKGSEYGAFGTNLWHEMGSAREATEFARFARVTDLSSWKQAMGIVSAPVRAARGVGQAVQNITQAREDILRASVYLDALADVEKYLSGQAKGVRHWPGRRVEIEAIAKEDKHLAASIISRETLGDYGKFTPWENDKLRNGLIPFYSWLRINTEFWPRVMLNSAKEEGMKAAGKTALVRAGRITYGAGKWVGRVTAAYGALAAWNNRDEEARKQEQSIPWHIRIRPHINTEMGPISDPSALTDFMEWFGLSQVAPHVARNMRGQTTLKEFVSDAAMELAKAPVNKVYQAITPYLKSFTTALGLRTYPDVFESRPFAQAFSSKAAASAVLEVLGSDVKAFVNASEGKASFKDVLVYYFSGSSFRPQDPDEVAKRLQDAILKSTYKRGTAKAAANTPHKGKDAEVDDMRARLSAMGRAAPTHQQSTGLPKAPGLNSLPKPPKAK